MTENEISCLVFTAQFSKVDSGKFLGVGGGGNHKAYFHETDGMNLVSEYEWGESSVYSMDFANHSNRVAIAHANGSLKILDLDSIGRSEG